MLKAGFARVDVTPPFGTPLAGYYERRYADGVLDPIYLNAIALNDGTDSILLITADVLLIRMEVCNLLREMISRGTGVEADHILINALHSHTSLWVGPGSRSAVKDPAFLDVFYRKFVDVAKMALDDMNDATLGIAIQEAAEPISFVRRYFLKDGTLKTNPGGIPIEDIVKPAARSDNRVRLLRFVREGKKEIALVNFCTHADVIGGTKVSADWPGFVRRFVEAEHPNSHCVLMNGFEGDTNHLDFMGERTKSQRGYMHSEKMGRVIAETVNQIWDETEPYEKTNIHGQIRIVFNKCSTRGEEFYEECKAYADRYRAGDYSAQKTKSGIEKAEACRIADIPEQPVYHKVMITMLGLGDIAFLGISGEPFTRYSYLTEEMAPDKFVVTVTCGNGCEDYLPSKQAFDQGGYEVICSHYTPELEDTVLGAVKEMLDNF